MSWKELKQEISMNRQFTRLQNSYEKSVYKGFLSKVGFETNFLSFVLTGI